MLLLIMWNLFEFVSILRSSKFVRKFLMFFLSRGKGGNSGNPRHLRRAAVTTYYFDSNQRNTLYHTKKTFHIIQFFWLIIVNKLENHLVFHQNVSICSISLLPF